MAERMTTQRRHLPSRGSQRHRPKAMNKQSFAQMLFSQRARVIVLGVFVVAAFLLGGSSRSEMPPLGVLNPLSVLVLGYGLCTLSWADIARHKLLAGLALAILILPLLQLVPLPPSIWHSLPGREPIVQLDAMLGMEGAWRPFTMDPTGTRNAVIGLFAPLAVLVLGMQAGRSGHEKALATVLAVGFVSAVLSLGQIIGDPHGPLYLYSITNSGFPVGLFANRNHHAVFLDSLIPLAYAWTMLAPGNWRDVDSPRGKRAILGFCLVILIVPVVLVAGSRAGLVCLALSLAATMALVTFSAEKGNRKAKDRKPALARMAPVMAIVFAIAALIFATIFMGRGRAFDRLVALDPGDDLRGQIAPTILQIITEVFPWGTGFGSFDNVYRSYELDALLSERYANHAHNDYLEFAMTGGLPAIIVIVLLLGWLGLQAWTLFRKGPRSAIQGHMWPVASLCALGLIVVASMVDYPLRTAAFSSFAVLLALWVARGTQVET